MKRALKSGIIVVLAFLIQGSIIPHLEIMGKKPNLLMAVVAIFAVAYTTVVSFGVSALIGILLETLLSTLPGLEIVLYPALGFIASILFGDKSERTVEQEIAAGKTGKNLSAHLRTILAIVFLMTVYEAINLTYVYLSVNTLSVKMILGGVWSVVYTTILTIVVMVPLRIVLGVYGKKKKGTSKTAH